MNFKKCLTILIILTIALVSISGVSAGFFDFLSGDNSGNSNSTSSSEPGQEPTLPPNYSLITSTMKLEYNEPVESTDYAYFYEGSGEYAEAAYWAPWFFKSIYRLDVEKIFEQEFGNHSNYTVDMFKKDLEYMVENDQVYIQDVDLNTGTPLNIHHDFEKCRLENNSSVLVVGCDYASDDYDDKDIISKVDKMKNASSADIKIRLYKNFNTTFKTGSGDIYIELTDLPVKVTKLN